MADHCEDTREEEGASSPVRQELPVSQSDDAFRAQLLAAVSTFTQVMQNPKFMAFLQPPVTTEPVETPGML